VRVAVTGATGNVGSLVVEQLLAAGHEVTGIARRAPAGGESGPGLRWLELDLTAANRRERLHEAFTGLDTVVHTAWGFQPTRNTAYLQRLDVGGTAAVLEAAAACGVGHLVHVSSVGVYSPGHDVGPVDEDWSTGGTPGLAYSRHKSAAERLLDAHEAVPGDLLPRIARMRPSLMAREEVGGALDRYTLPSLLPAAALGALPVLPLDRGFRVQLTHTSDVASGICAAVQQGATGPFNLAADPVLTPADVAEAFGATSVHLPWRALRALATAAWAARLQPVDPGWLDMAWDVPVLSSRRARDELGWAPRHDPREVLAHVVRGMVHQNGLATPALRPRRWPDQLSNLVRHGPVSRRRMA
jgi:UDP-glucose 4-epimerase